MIVVVKCFHRKELIIYNLTLIRCWINYQAFVYEIENLEICLESLLFVEADLGF